MVNRISIDLRLTKHMHVIHDQSNQKTRHSRKGIHALKMTQPNDNTFTIAGELIDLHVEPGIKCTPSKHLGFSGVLADQDSSHLIPHLAIFDSNMPLIDLQRRCAVICLDEGQATVQNLR